MHGRRHGQAGEFQQGGGNVHVERGLIAGGTGFDETWVTHHQRDANRRFVHEAFVVHAPFAEKKTVIGSDDDGGIVELPRVFEEIDDAAKIFVVVDHAG